MTERGKGPDAPAAAGRATRQDAPAAAGRATRQDAPATAGRATRQDAPAAARRGNGPGVAAVAPRAGDPAAAAAALTRRESLRRIGRVLGLVAVVEAAAAVGIYVWPRTPRPREGAYGGVITAGPVGNFEPGTVTAFAKGQFYLVRMKDGGFLALSRKCTHLGCTVPWVEAERKFACPCHASSFSETGEVLSAPAPRPLDLYRVTVEDGVVKVDTSVAVTRDRFEPAQAVRG